MAASTKKTYSGTVTGPGGYRTEFGTITFDADATVELPTSFTQILGCVFTPIGTGAVYKTVSLNEANASGITAVPSTGTLTVAASASNSDTYFYALTGR